MPPVKIELVGHFADLDGTLGCVAVRDNSAYLGVGAELIHIDVSDPTQPTRRGRGRADVRVVQAICLSGEYAFVGGTDGLAIMEIGSENPRTIGSYSTSPVRAVVAALPYVYLSAGCFQVVDVSVPAHPVQAGRWDEGLGAYALAASGKYVYLGDAGGLRIIDVSIPSAPREVDECNTAAFPEDAALADGFLYLASEHSGLRVIEIADQTILNDVGHFNTWRDIPDSVIDGESGNVQAVAAWGHYAYVVFAGSGLRVIDVADPTSPREVGFYRQPGPVDVTVAGGYVYLATYFDGLHILRASPSGP